MISRKRGSGARAISASTAVVTSSWRLMIIGLPCTSLRGFIISRRAMAKEPARGWKGASIRGKVAQIEHRRIAVATLTDEKTGAGRAKVDARAAMEALNAEAGPLN